MKKTAKRKIPALPTAAHLRALADLLKKPPETPTCPDWLNALCVFFGCCPTPPAPVPGPHHVKVSVR